MLTKRSPTYTRAEVLALTMTDVAVARSRAAAARETRAGVSTIDFVLSDPSVKDTAGLEAAKEWLLKKL